MIITYGECGEVTPAQFLGPVVSVGRSIGGHQLPGPSWVARNVKLQQPRLPHSASDPRKGVFAAPPGGYKNSKALF